MSEDYRWGGDLKLLHQQLNQHGDSFLASCDEQDPHEVFAGKLYKIASAEISDLETQLKEAKKENKRLREALETNGILEKPICNLNLRYAK